ncbi:MAG: RIP metalloprotease RseP [Verrucomicrobiota bacterium]
MLLNLFYITVAIFALGFCIFVHELGHFIAAKKRGLVADRFSVGFGPRLFGWKSNGTDFRLSLIPLGGYVSLPQLVDMGRLEGGVKDEADALPPISYTDKMVVAVMGAVFNLIFAFLLSLILWGVGREVIKSTEVDLVYEQMVNAEGEVVPGPAKIAGILPGDTILSVDGQRIGDWDQFTHAILLGTGRSEDKRPQAQIEVLRGGEVVAIELHPILKKFGIDSMRTAGVAPSGELVVIDVLENMPAFAGGLKANDILHSLDGQLIESSSFLQLFLSQHEGGPVQLTVVREGEFVPLSIEPRVTAESPNPLFGFRYEVRGVNTVRVHYNPFEQLSRMANRMKDTLYALVHVNSDVGVKNMSGPVGIVHGLTTMARFGIVDLIWFLALINVNLAIFNLLPIPVLDGGHMLFATISKLRGRPLPISVMEKVQGAFMVLLLGMVLYVTFFDVGRVGYDLGLIKDEPVAAESATEAAE